MTGKIGEDIQRGEKHPDGEDGLGEVGQLHQKVLGEEPGRGPLVDEAADLVKNIKGQPKGEKGGDDKEQGEEDRAPRIFFDDFHHPWESRGSPS